MSTPEAPVPPPPAPDTRSGEQTGAAPIGRGVLATIAVLVVLLLGAIAAWAAQYQTTLDEAEKVRSLRAERDAGWESDASSSDSAASGPASASDASDAEVAKLEKDGFKDTGHPGLYWRFTPEWERPSCSLGSCVFVDVASTTATCGSVYIEGNAVDDSDVIVGYTNDRIGALRAGDKARAELSILQDDGTGVRLSEVTCR